MNHRADDSDTMPLEGDPELTAAERLALRRLIREVERAVWARRQLRLWAPILVGVVSGMAAAWAWLANHVKVTP